MKKFAVRKIIYFYWAYQSSQGTEKMPTPEPYNPVLESGDTRMLNLMYRTDITDAGMPMPTASDSME